MNINIKDSFNKELPADPNETNTRRQVHNACFSYVTPRKPSKPQVLHVSREVADLLGIQDSEISSESFRDIFSGAKVMEHTRPYAMCYGGHQFGNWAGQLGDGRAINLGEVLHNNQRWAMQLKGAGATPYSRSADGLAVLRSSIREHLCSEAMHHLGIPTTRSLCLSTTGDDVLRDMLYDGNPEYEKGAVVCRVSPSFIRFGNFQIFAARGEKETLKQLTEYTIKHFFPHIPFDTKAGYVQFFKEVTERTNDMVVHWQRVGFVHGVMNTDNMSILGLTIDYGPYGWLEGYDPDWTPNTTDRHQRRYRFGNQPNVALWNIVQLANALYPLIEETAPFEEIIEDFKVTYTQKHLEMMKEKIGLTGHQDGDKELIADLQKMMEQTELDMTIFFRTLSEFDPYLPNAPQESIPDPISNALYTPLEINDKAKDLYNEWFMKYSLRLRKEKSDNAHRKLSMQKANPKYVLRNYMAQLAIDDANKGEFGLIEELFEMLKSPYDEQPNMQKWFALRPEWARSKVGCSMLSCSS